MKRYSERYVVTLVVIVSLLLVASVFLSLDGTKKPTHVEGKEKSTLPASQAGKWPRTEFEHLWATYEAYLPLYREVNLETKISDTENLTKTLIEIIPDRLRSDHPRNMTMDELSP